MRLRALSALLAIVLAGCPSSSGHAPDQGGVDGGAAPKAVPAEEAVATATAVNQFALDLHRELGKRPGDVFFSPASIAAALGMTWAGANGPTADQLAKALHVTLPPEKAHPALGALLAADASGDPTLAAANRLWCLPEDLLPAFLAATKDAYGAEVGQVDFRTDPDGARQTINRWVEERTRDRIKDLVPSGTLTPLTRLVLTNAIYFKGSWKTAFDGTETRTGTFTLATREAVGAPLMHAAVPGRFFHGDGFVLGELPYKGERLSMVVIVPAEPDGLPALEAKLTADALASWLAAARHVEKLDVTLPRFKIEQAVDLVPPLQALGVNDAFSQTLADLSGMNGKKDLYVSAALHKAFVEVTEAGTEAAAATAVVVGVKSAAEPPPTVRADRPFLFLIRDTQTGLILFLGRETDPRS